MSEKNAANIPEDILTIISGATHVVLLTHVHPDGDAIGSSLGFADILAGMGKKVQVFFEEPLSALYHFLPGRKRATYDIEEVIDFVAGADGGAAVVALDSGDDRRLGRHLEEFRKISPFLVIDHHKSHRDYGEHRWVEPGMSSTGEMIYTLAKVLEAEVSLEAAENLYVAICTDTGSFQYEATSSTTHRIAADLVEYGVRPEKMARCLYDNLSLPRIRLLQLVLGTLKVYSEGQLAFVHVTREMIDQTGATPFDIEGFVNFPRSLGTVKVAVFIKDIDQGLISVSLRSKGEVDVAEVAYGLQGGGHRNAAGFRVRGRTLEEVYELVLHELQPRLAGIM